MRLSNLYPRFLRVMSLLRILHVPPRQILHLPGMLVISGLTSICHIDQAKVHPRAPMLSHLWMHHPCRVLQTPEPCLKTSSPDYRAHTDISSLTYLTNSFLPNPIVPELRPGNQQIECFPRRRPAKRLRLALPYPHSSTKRPYAHYPAAASIWL